VDKLVSGSCKVSSVSGVGLAVQVAAAAGVVTVLLWAVAIRYGAFGRRSQRAYQDALADANQVTRQAHGSVYLCMAIHRES
jgi:hypothetical protein